MTGLGVQRWIAAVAAAAPDISIIKTTSTSGDWTFYAIAACRGVAWVSTPSIERVIERGLVGIGPADWLRAVAMQQAELRQGQGRLG